MLSISKSLAFKQRHLAGSSSMPVQKNYFKKGIEALILYKIKCNLIIDNIQKYFLKKCQGFVKKKYRQARFFFRYRVFNSLK